MTILEIDKLWSKLFPNTIKKAGDMAAPKRPTPPRHG